MGNIIIQKNMLCASEFALAIALTVFILITVILTLLLIFLAASKNFRAVFFREKHQKKKSGKKQTRAPAFSEPETQGVDTIPLEPAPKTRKAATKRSESAPEYLNAIPTVPLGGIPAPTQPAQRPRASRRVIADDSADDHQAQASNGSTYTTRSITITRARSSGSSQAKTETAKQRNDKKR